MSLGWVRVVFFYNDADDYFEANDGTNGDLLGARAVGNPQ